MMIKDLDQVRTEAATEKARTEELLANILPVSIVDELKKVGKVQPKYTPSATILFADFKGLTLLAERHRTRRAHRPSRPIFHGVRRHRGWL